jgi:two-component sensor histidine kinase
MSIEKAIPAGLILNEICMNAFKHAFPAGFPVEDPRLTIALHEHGGGAVELSIRDNGVGLPKDLDFRETHSVGMQIVMTLVRQLQGNIRLEPGPGTWFTIEFQARDAG